MTEDQIPVAALVMQRAFLVAVADGQYIEVDLLKLWVASGHISTSHVRQVIGGPAQLISDEEGSVANIQGIIQFPVL